MTDENRMLTLTCSGAELFYLLRARDVVVTDSSFLTDRKMRVSLEFAESELREILELVRQYGRSVKAWPRTSQKQKADILFTVRGLIVKIENVIDHKDD